MQAKIVFGLLLVGIVLLAGCLGSSSRPPKPELCSQVSIPDNKDNCFERVAISTGDAGYCASISDLNTRDQCYTGLAEGRTWMD